MRAPANIIQQLAVRIATGEDTYFYLAYRYTYASAWGGRTSDPAWQIRVHTFTENLSFPFLNRDTIRGLAQSKFHPHTALCLFAFL
jgi:hypothetical protein